MTVPLRIENQIAIISLQQPPLNALGLACRLATMQALRQALAAPEVQAIVLTGAGKAFSSGADMAEFGTAQAIQAPNLPDMIAALEAAHKPVVAAVHGVAMGGGLELALGCAYRVVAADTAVAMPEVKLGLVPGAGGTQRLPRALGVEAALNLMVSGKTVKAAQLAQVPGQTLWHEVVPAEAVLQAAVALAQRVVAQPPEGGHPCLARQPCQHPQRDAYLQFARNSVRPLAKTVEAPLRVIDLVDAATRRPFTEGLAEEQRVFMALLHSPESTALRHAFLAERQASRVPGVADDTPLRPIREVAVLGAGTMGSGIALTFLNAGLPVKLYEPKAEALERGLANIRSTYNSQVKKGRLSEAERDQRLALLQPVPELAALNTVDLALEAVFEDLAVKESVFRDLDRVLKPGAILASNTSTLDLDRLAQVTARPQDVIGLHFFSPAHVMPLLEIVRGAATAADVLATALALGKTLRKTRVVAGVCDGFIGNRMIEQYLRQAGFLLDEGCTPQQIDRAIERFGFAMGPFRMNDLAGNDIGQAIRDRRRRERPDMPISATADRLCQMGRLGQKTGKGWYDYLPGKRDAQPSAEVLAMLADYRREHGITPRKVADTEIVQRLLLALVNEGARLLEEGIALRAGDIDVVYVAGYGFPAWRGGPMFYADQLGLYNVVATMRQFAANPQADPVFWQPAPLLARLAEQGGRFTR